MKKMFDVLEDFNSGWLRALDFWNKPNSPTWRGKSGDEYVHYELTKASFKDYDAHSFDKTEDRQQFIDKIKSQWLAKCAIAHKGEDKSAGIDPGIVEATDYQALARQAWEDGDYEAKYLAQLDHYCHKLSSMAALWARIIPIAVLLIVLIAAGMVWDALNRSAFNTKKAKLQETYQAHLAEAKDEQTLVPQIRAIYESENTDTREARLSFASRCAALFEKGVTKTPLSRDEEILHDFFEQDLKDIDYSDGQGFWFLKRLPLPEFSDPELSADLTDIMGGKQADPNLFDFLDKLYPYTDIQEGQFHRLKLLHDWANIDPSDSTAVDRHFNSIKSQLSDLKQTGHLVGQNLKLLETWLDSGCSPDGAGDLLAPTLNPLQASKLVNTINAIKCAKYCDRLTACRNAGSQREIATCLVDSIQALFNQNVNLNRELLEYVKFRSAIWIFKDEPEKIDRLFFTENPEFSDFPGKTFIRPSGTCPQFGEPCDMIPVDRVAKEFAATVNLLDALNLRKKEYHTFFTPEKISEIKNAFPSLTIIPGEGNLWTAMEPHVHRLIWQDIKQDGDGLLREDKWVAAFDRYQALIALDDEIELLESDVRPEVEAHILLSALALHYDHRLKAAPEDAPQFIRRFAGGDHGFFMQSSSGRLGSDNQQWFRTHLQGKRLVKNMITVKSPTIEKIKTYL